MGLNWVWCGICAKYLAFGTYPTSAVGALWCKRKNNWTYEVHPEQRLTQVYKFSPTQVILGCSGIGEDSIIIHSLHLGVWEAEPFQITDMDISPRIVIPTLLLFVLFIGEGHNGCLELQCGYGPPIRFPFRLKDRQPDQHCGYPGFDLYCSHNNDTVLELPNSVKAFVKNIDYKSQLIEVTTPFSVVRQI